MSIAAYGGAGGVSRRSSQRRRRAVHRLSVHGLCVHRLGAHRLYASLRPVGVLVLLVLAAAVWTPQAAAQAGEAEQEALGPEVAVLVQGPTRGQELPFLGPNVVEYWRGVYEYQQDRFAVYFTRNEVFGLGSWALGTCGGRTAQYVPRRALPDGGDTPRERDDDTAAEVPDPDAPGLWHIAPDEEAWHLFVDVDEFAGDACEIMPLFLERLIFFYDALGRRSNDSPLPAVLDPFS